MSSQESRPNLRNSLAAKTEETQQETTHMKQSPFNQLPKQECVGKSAPVGPQPDTKIGAKTWARRHGATRMTLDDEDLHHGAHFLKKSTATSTHSVDLLLGPVKPPFRLAAVAPGHAGEGRIPQKRKQIQHFLQRVHGIVTSNNTGDRQIGRF